MSLKQASEKDLKSAFEEGFEKAGVPKETLKDKAFQTKIAVLVDRVRKGAERFGFTAAAFVDVPTPDPDDDPKATELEKKEVVLIVDKDEWRAKEKEAWFPTIFPHEQGHVATSAKLVELMNARLAKLKQDEEQGTLQETRPTKKGVEDDIAKLQEDADKAYHKKVGSSPPDNIKTLGKNATDPETYKKCGQEVAEAEFKKKFP